MSNPAHVCSACVHCAQPAKADDTPFLKWMTRRQDELRDEQTIPPKKPDSLVPAQQLVEACNARATRLLTTPFPLAPPFNPSETDDLKMNFAGPKHFSSTPLGELKRIELRSMYLRRKHTGRYLLLRIVSRLCKAVGIGFIGQDPGGNACVVGLYSSPWALVAPGPELDATIPLGSTIIIREPWLKAGEDGGPIVRVDSATDIVFLNEDLDLKGLPWKDPAIKLPDQRPQTLAADEYKVRGNAYLAKGWLIPADRAYSEGLRIDSSHVALRLNRAAARLKMGLWRSSLADSRAVLALDRTSYAATQLEKALFRAATAEYALQLWERAKARFAELLMCNPASKEGKDGLVRVGQRIKEARTGEYAWGALFLKSQTDPKLDIADYVCPDVRIEDRKGRGRGLVANRSLTAGQLLMVVKPFASCTWDEVKDGRDLVCANLHSESLEGTLQAHLTQTTVRRLMEDPSLSDVFGLLYAGPSYPTPPSFSISRLRPKEEVTAGPVDIDTTRIELVRTLNSFGRRRLGYTFERGVDDDYPGEEGVRTRVPAALYVLPSLINHACSPNAVWSFLGESMVVRLTRDLKEGEEITISYTAGCDYETRVASLKKHGITCGTACIPCTEDRLDSRSDRLERKALLAELKALRPPSSVWDSGDGKGAQINKSLYDATKEVIEDLNGTYNPARRMDYCWEMWAAYHHIGNLCSLFSIFHPDPAGRSEWTTLSLFWEGRGLSSIGAGELLTEDRHAAVRPHFPHEPSLVEHAIGSCLLIASTMRITNNAAGMKRWLKAARHLDNIGGGHDLALFKQRWDQVLLDYELRAGDLPA